MRSRVVAAAVLAAAAGSLPVEASAPTPPSSAALASWDHRYGWDDLPALPATVPTETWTLSDSDVVDSTAVGDVLVVLRRAGDGYVLDRLDVQTGEAMWTREVSRPVDRGRARLGLRDRGELVIVEFHWVDSTGDDAWSTRVIDADDGTEIRNVNDLPWVGGDAEHGVFWSLFDIAGVDPATGERRWERDGVVDWIGDVLVLHDPYATDVTYASPIVVDPVTGDELWAAPEPSDETSAWVVDDSLLMVTKPPNATDGTLVAADLGDGTVRFEREVQTMRAPSFVSGGDGVAVMSDTDGDADLAAGIDLVTGATLWETDQIDVAPTAVRVGGTGGEVYLIDLDMSGVEIYEAATGEVVASGDISSATGDVYPYGPYVYHRVGSELIAYTVPGLAEAWRVDVGGDIGIHPVTGGFVAVDRSDDGTRRLRGFLAP